MKTKDVEKLLDTQVKIYELNLQLSKLKKDFFVAKWNDEDEKTNELEVKRTTLEKELNAINSETLNYLITVPLEIRTTEYISICEEFFSTLPINKFNSNARKAFLQHFANEFDELTTLHDQLMKEERFKEANELVEQRIALAKFLGKN
jgi:hypothetical protein